MASELDSEDQFEYWLAHMDDALDELFARLPEETRRALDYSPASLDAFEAWLLSRYPSPAALMTDEALPDLDGAARYVGEVIRKTLGGRWRIRLDNPKYAFHGLPELTFLAKKDTPECPIASVTAATDRRTGHYLRGVLDGLREVITKARGAAT